MIGKFEQYALQAHHAEIIGGKFLSYAREIGCVVYQDMIESVSMEQSKLLDAKWKELVHEQL